VANGENVKVVQELMRYASSRSTLEIYTQATIEDKRAAQQRLVQMLVSEAAESSAFDSEATTRDVTARGKNPTGFDLMIKWETEEQEKKYM
jgi:hypothetical protein